MSEQYPDIDSIFMSAIEIESPPQRDAYLQRACGHDAQLRARLEKLLAAHFKAGTFLESRAAGLPTELSEGIEAGTAIGPYKLLEQIGEGGMGVVFRAQQTQPVQREVALKIIKLGMDTKQVIARFDAERQALAVMDHPNIARVYDAGATDTGRPYFVMELVRGIPITEYCDKHNLSIPQRLELFEQVCHAVQHAHQKGLIHRDIKPSNILVRAVDDKPVAKVIDFGIAKATQSRLTEKTLFTEHHQLIGTPEYMSPEQAEGTLDVDTRSDVYSLGVLLYELLVGTPPFDARELRSKAYAEMQRVIREVDPPRPSTRLSTLETLPSVAARRGTEPRKLSASIRGELDWIVMKCLEKDRTRRYDSASALAADVSRHLADEPVAAGPPSQIYRMRKFVRRNRAAVIGAAAMVLLLVAGITGTTVGLLEARKQRDEAKRQEQQAKEQTAIAEAINRFQNNMLSSVAPHRLFGDKVTVLEVLTAAIGELDAGKLKDHPLVEASVRETIAETLTNLGRFDVALPQYQKVLEIRRRVQPADRASIARTLGSLAVVLQNQGKYSEAEPMLRESLAMFRQALPPGDPLLPRTMTHLSNTLGSLGRFDEAETLARQAIEIHRQNAPIANHETSNYLTNLAVLFKLQGQNSQAEPLYREALEIRRRTLPPQHPGVARAIGGLASALMNLERYDEAEPLMREELAMQRKSLSADHPDTGKTLANLAWNLLGQNKSTEAEQCYREAITILEKAIGANHWVVGTCRGGLGVALVRQDRFSEAEPELLAGERILANAQGVPPGRYDRAVTELIALYEAWDKAEPGKGYDLKAQHWQARLPTTRPKT